MRKSWIIALSIIVVLIIAIQFFQPEKNMSKENLKGEIVFQMEIPKNVKKKIVNACYDCHSNTTHYPFYGKIAPVSWMLGRHIREGKARLNFSEWAGYDRRQQLKLLTEICEVITEGEMPMKGYVFMHSRARFNERDIADVCAWAEQAAEQVLSAE